MMTSNHYSPFTKASLFSRKLKNRKVNKMARKARIATKKA
jgi:hypothetical protein